jgi:hypothetical protein
VERETEPIRWIYPIVGGVISESLTIALIALVVTLTGHGGTAPGGDPIAQRIAAVMSATVGSGLSFVLGWWAARRADSRFEAHGLLTGAAAGFLTALGAFYGPPDQAAYGLLAALIQLFAGRAGGRMAGKMAAL